MSEQIIEDNATEREALVPIVTKIIGIYVVLMVASYYVGNMIYQIP